MCNKHIPIIVYDCGGKQTYCEKCGKPISQWEQNNKPKKHPKKKENKK